MIQVNRVCKSFGQFQAVSDLTLSLGKGEIVGMLGLNGAGKSTTLKMLSGLLKPDSGSVSIDGVDLARFPRLAQTKIGYLPEGAPSYRELTVWQMLKFLSGVRGLNGKACQSRLNFVIDALELRQVLLNPIETLSKGFKRRVGLAQALLHDPQVLLLDEPTDGLDPRQKQQVRELIKKLSTTATGKSVLISTHHFDDIEALCDRLLILDQGRLICDIQAETLKRQQVDFHHLFDQLVDGQPLGAIS